jgi:lysozyme family protein
MQSFKEKRVVKNSDIPANLKNLPGWKFFGRKREHVQGERLYGSSSVHIVTKNILSNFQISNTILHLVTMLSFFLP